MNRAAILAEIAEAYQQRTRREFEFTRQEFAEVTGMTYYKATRTLARMVANGELLSEQAHVNGRQTLVYWRPGDEVSTT